VFCVVPLQLTLLLETVGTLDPPPSHQVHTHFESSMILDFRDDRKLSYSSFRPFFLGRTAAFLNWALAWRVRRKGTPSVRFSLYKTCRSLFPPPSRRNSCEVFWFKNLLLLHEVKATSGVEPGQCRMRLAEFQPKLYFFGMELPESWPCVFRFWHPKLTIDRPPRLNRLECAIHPCIEFFFKAGHLVFRFFEFCS